MFQFYNLVPSLTARENVQLVTDIAEDPMDPGEALRLVGLGDRMDHFPGRLSGGETHNAPIAAMAHRVVVLSDGLVKSDTANASRTAAEQISW